MGKELYVVTRAFWLEPKQPETRSISVVFGLFREIKNKKFWFVSVCFRCFSENYQNMLFIKLFRVVFCLEAKQPKTNCFETNQNKPKQTGKTLNFFLKKHQKKLSIKLFR
jgi:hypothetical protein